METNIFTLKKNVFVDKKIKYNDIHRDVNLHINKQQNLKYKKQLANNTLL